MIIVFKPVMFEDFTHQKGKLKNCYQSKNILLSRKTVFPSLFHITYFIRKTTRISSNYINYLENRKPAQFLPRKHKHSAVQRVDFGRVIWTEITFLTYFRRPQLSRLHCNSSFSKNEAIPYTPLMHTHGYLTDKNILRMF